MRLHEIVANGTYSIFSRMGDENRTKHLDVIRYIMQMAAATETDISEWNIMELFGTGRGNTMVQDRREINRRFLEKARENVRSSEPQDVELPDLDQLQAEVDHRMREALANNILQIRNNQRAVLQQAQSYYNHYIQHLSSAFQLENQMSALTRRNMNVADQIRQIVAGGFWVYETHANNIVTFHTRSEVVLTEVNRNLGINRRVNLGKFKAEIDLAAGQIWVDTKSNNTVVGDGIIHPHATTNSICWGNSSNTVHQKLLAYDFVGVMQLLANLLMDYNPDNPYASLYSFAEKQAFDNATRLRGNGASLDDIKVIFQNAGLEDISFTRYCERNGIRS
jgi:hypothetical protein